MTPPAKRRRNMKHDNYVDAGATVDEPRRDITPSGMQLHPHNLPPRQAQRSQIRARISNQIVVPEKPIPATAPLLTTDRSNTRVMKRIKPEDRDPRRDTESSYLEPSVSLHHDFPGDHMHERSFVYHRDVANSEGTQFYADEVPLNAVVGGYMSEKLITDQLHPGQIVVTENGQQVIYEPVEVEVDEDGNIRDQLMVGEDLIFADEIIEEDPRERVEIDTGTDGQPMTQKTDTTTKDDKNSSSEGQDEDEAPPELEPEENLAPEEIMQLEQMERGTYQETEYVEGIGEVIRVQSPGGTQQLIPVAADGDGNF
ncbi:hypothetical protein AB6A40_011366 [Gnathostoma spinigerum]|uniref:Zinc finger protein n=1 Tax=Gnathostoma spinigerum TaxID=75299 RepID=A0ABD6EZQ7_9BILA